jgi:maltose alpha-D-glucosyltransferase / alpha-amylase
MTDKRDKPATQATADPLWYKHGVIYQAHVKAFHDSNADGIGDLPGLTEKLDYLQDLGVSAIWLLPFYPSPLKDDGYDIADYTTVNPSYGTLADCKRFIAEAHARGMRVITELVINHTSDQHPWFQKARRAPKGSKARDFYVWSDTPERYPGVRIIFQDFESSNWAWDPVAGQYYWHRFYSHQPDLNFANAEVQRAVFKVMDQWFALGVDGMRLDAVPYLFEREGTNCENLPETHEVLRKLRAHVDEHWPGSMLLAEANQWPEDAVHYFGKGDECHMCFHFPVMPRLFMAIQMEDSYPVIDIMQQTPAIPANCQWAVFLRNHDELTLEMVTDEERDYMYRAYAANRQARINLGIRRRLAPLLNNHRRKIELMNGLLFALPGTPIIYYGDEIGMGDNVYLGDRNGVRTPMQWSGDRNAGFSRANPQQLYLPIIIDPEYHYETVNVEAQQQNPSSLLWWTKRLIALRKRHPVFGSGELEFLSCSNPKVLAFIRRDQRQQVLVVANLSRFVQPAEIDLPRFKGATPIELFGTTRFPPIGDQPYFLTLAPHSFYWFGLEAPAPINIDTPAADRPAITLRNGWDLADRSARPILEQVLLADVPTRRWYAAKARTIAALRLRSVIPLRTAAPAHEIDVSLAVLDITFTEGEAQSYIVPLALASQERAARIVGSNSALVIATVTSKASPETRVLYDAAADPAFPTALLHLIARRRRHKAEPGELVGIAENGDMRRDLLEAERIDPRMLRVEQSNTSVLFGDRFIMKLYRKLEPGVNPDLEIGRFLTETAHFPYIPPVAGAVEYQRDGAEPLTIAMLQRFVPNQGDAWSYTLDQLGQFYESVLTSTRPPPDVDPALTVLDRIREEPPAAARDLFGHYLDSARLLGQRTAEMHKALASGADKAFAPEPFTQLSQRSLYQSLRNATRRTFLTLRQYLKRAPADLRQKIEPILARESEIIDAYRAVTSHTIDVQRIRHHGDYHLGQVLYTGKDFVIIDFEGEPARPLGERRIKRSALRDVAGMIRSFEYAAYVYLLEQTQKGSLPAARADQLEPWADFWSDWVGSAFLRSYLRTAHGERFIPQSEDDLRLLLRLYLLEKAVYELGYELNSRPAWVGIPLRGISHLLGPAPALKE